ncbi:AraC family transcriptional regulator [Salinibius halmophilus]|uniref:AraC family transcriptional regulator n=1 Tax=Salinibius halmophilus TaxID=1853216 RepID=UPI000E66F203|nr:AraC family transcriptional regulator [Salinibius halmophilus]
MAPEKFENTSSYQKRFEVLVGYIEQNLEQPLSLGALCQHAHLSKYHFHRQFKAYFGVSVMQLIKLLRLKRAAYQLAYREVKVIDVALDCGYQNHESFSRAFKQHFALSPIQFAETGAGLIDGPQWQQLFEPIVNMRSQTMLNPINMPVTIVDFPATKIALYQHQGAQQYLGQSIAQFIDWRKANATPPSKSRTFNLLYDDPNEVMPEDYRFGIACEVKEPVAANAQGVVNDAIPAMRCACVRHIGSDDGIEAVVTYLYGKWLPENGEMLADFPIFLERIRFFPEVAEHEAITDVYLPLKSAL